MASNLVVGFAIGTAGAVMIGIAKERLAQAKPMSGVGASDTVGAPAGGVVGTAAAQLPNSGHLKPDAQTFVNRLSRDTGLSTQVIAGWVMAETSGWDTTNGANNWLNVGSFDSGFAGGGANVWTDPTTAADATAAFITGKPVNGISPPLGGGDPTIQAIIRSAGASIEAQVQAIQNSNWAGSHYGYNLISDVRQFL